MEQSSPECKLTLYFPCFLNSSQLAGSKTLPNKRLIRVTNMQALMTRFLRNRSGAALIECTLIGAIAVIAVISGLALFAGKPHSILDYQSAQIQHLDQR